MNLSQFPSNFDLFYELIKMTNIELKRLNWSTEQCRQYLFKRYRKRSRQVLSEEEFIELLEFLKSLPN